MEFDKEGNELRIGDKVELEIIGVGIGECEIKENEEGMLCLYDPLMGGLPLKIAKYREDLVYIKID